TASGLKYRILRPGQGTSAAAGDYVLIHYATLTPDGAVLDSTRDSEGQGDPIAFVLWAGQVIRGWDLGIAGMQVGEKRRLVVPSQLVQSPELRLPTGTPSPELPPLDLQFDIELVDVLPGVLQRVTREGNVGGRLVRPGEMVEIEY